MIRVKLGRDFFGSPFQTIVNLLSELSMRCTSLFHNHPRFERLESRRLLAADPFAKTLALDVNVDGQISAVDALGVINGLNDKVAAGRANPESAPSAEEIDELLKRIDANLDGTASPSDALRIINEISIAGVVDVGARLVGQIRDRLGESRPGFLTRVYGEAESTDAALGELVEGINLLRDDARLSPEQAGQFLDDLTGVIEEITLPSLGSIVSLTEVWNSAWSDQQISDTEQQQLRIALDDILQSAGVDSQRIDSLLNTAEQVYDVVGNELDNGQSQFDYQALLTGLQQILRGLPEFEFLGALDDSQFTQVVEQVGDLIRGEGGVTTVISVIDIFRDAGWELTSPSIGSTLSLVATFQSVRSDGVIDATERPELLSSLDRFFISMDMEDAPRTALLDLVDHALQTLS